MEVWTRHDCMSDDIEVRVRLNGRTHTRILNGMQDRDHRDLRIAAMYWRCHDRALELGEREAALTEGCLAVERLFPHLREELPA